MEEHTCHRKGNLIFTGRRFLYVFSPSKIDISLANLSGMLINLETNTMIVFDSFNLIAGNQNVQKPRECERERDVLKDFFFSIFFIHV